MKLAKLILLTTLLLSTPCFADGAGGSTCMPDCNAYVQEDHFKWTNYDDQIHMLAAYSISITSAMIIEHGFKLSKLESALLGAVFTGMIGTAKEVFHDDYTSRTDIKTWWLGAATAGFTVVVFDF